MALVRKDVTIKSSSTISKDESIGSVKMWLRTLQESPEFEDDTYYAEVFDSRDKSIYRIFSTAAIELFELDEEHYDILTPEMFNNKEYIDSKLYSSLTREQIMAILSDYALKGSNTSDSTGAQSSHDLVTLKNDIYVEMDRKTSELNDEIYEITNTLSGMITREQVIDLLEDNYYTKVQVDSMVSDLTSDVSLLNNISEERVVELVTAYIDNNSVFENIDDIQEKILEIENSLTEPTTGSLIDELLLDNDFNKLIDENILKVFSTDFEYLTKNDIYLLFNNLKQNLTATDSSLLDGIHRSLSEIHTIKERLEQLEIDKDNYITDSEFSEMLKSLVTVEDFYHTQANVQDSLDRILSISDIVNDDMFKQSISASIESSLDTIAKNIPTANTTSDILTDGVLTDALKPYVTSNIMVRYLENYISSASINQYLDQYVTLERFNSIIDSLATKEDINVLNQKISEIDSIDKDYIDQLNSLMSNYTNMSIQLQGVYSAIDDINEELDNEWYCKLKKDMIQAKLEISKIHESFIYFNNIQKQNVSNISANTTKLRSLMDIQSSLSVRLDSMLLDVRRNELEIERLSKLVDDAYDSDTLHTTINNHIDQYMIDNPIDYDITNIINVDHIENTINTNSTSINEILVLMESINDRYVTLDDLNESLNHDYDDAIWKSLNEGFNSYNPCNHLNDIHRK